VNTLRGAPRLGRRSRTTLVGSWCGALLLWALGATPALAANAIQAENALPGDSYWMAATKDPSTANPAPIEGYAGATSVRPGGTITFHVSTNPPARYRIEISRLGWYGGAGGRRVSCLVGASLDPTCTHDHLGVTQPPAPAGDPATGEISAGWSTTDTLDVPQGWTTGYYVAVFTLTSGPAAGQTGFAPFIVEAPPGDHSAILVQVPTNTWQAYNPWGGEDFYTTPRAVKISFDRPYAHRLLFNWEYPLVRFLERGGWEVSYATDEDVDANPSILLDHSLDMSAGHDEYWSKAMRDGWEAARDAGVNLAFMGANDGYWQVRYEDGGRTLVGYKYTPDPYPDPTQQTAQFRSLQTPRPECQLMGVEFQGTVLYHRYLDYTADAAVANDPWFGGTGLTSGSVLPGLGGYEIDSVTPGCHVPPPTPLLSYSGPPYGGGGAPTHADAVRYTACSGAEVFSAGSLQFSWGLDSWRDPSYSDPALPPEPPASGGLQLAMSKALSDLTQSHVPQPGPPHICVPTPGFTASLPWAAVGQPVTFSSTATDQYGQIAGQDWSFSGTGRAAGASGPAITEAFTRPGSVGIRLRVSDTSGASTTTVGTIRVCACPAPGSTGAPWPLEAQTGAACQLVPIGSLGRVRHQLVFTPNPGIGSFTVRTYRLAVVRGTIRLILVPPITASRPPSRLTLRTPAAPTLIDVTSQSGRFALHQQFLVPYGSRSAQPGKLTALACDGTSATVLTPAFGGRHHAALRVRAAAPGKLLVSIARIGGATLYRRVITSRGRSLIVVFGGRHLVPGVYRITIVAQHSPLRQPLSLIALAV